jgi:hypothetical protein
MNVKQQLAYNLNKILYNYKDSNNICRLYKQLNKLNGCISKNTSNDLYDEYKCIIKTIYDDIINGEDDITIINDCIFIIQKISLGLLLFE